MRRRSVRKYALRQFRGRLEQQSLEFSSEELAKSALIVAPHPDDEILGCGGIIIKKCQAGADVKVLILSDGRHSHPRIDPEVLGAIRCDEARMACRTLGLSEDAVYFGAFEDQSLALELEAATQKIEDLLRRDRPEQIFVPFRFDRPEDHYATYRAATLAIEKLGLDVVCYEYPVWFWENWPWSSLQSRHPFRLINAFRLSGASYLHVRRNLWAKLSIPDVLEQKREALLQYSSQMVRPENDPDWPILEDVAQGEFLANFLAPCEFFAKTEFRGGSALRSTSQRIPPTIR
jgi:LmbE family N-acetylglucosaminyl deacetylase